MRWASSRRGVGIQIGVAMLMFFTSLFSGRVRQGSTVSALPLFGLGHLAIGSLSARSHPRVDVLLAPLRTAFPAAETGSQRPPKSVRPSPLVWPAFVS